MILKKLWLFYIILYAPGISIFVGLKLNFLIGANFVWSLAAYLFLYQPLICGLRLIECKKIEKKKFFFNFIPFWRDKYWLFLFFNIEKN
jgi:hypothetical protein